MSNQYFEGNAQRRRNEASEINHAYEDELTKVIKILLESKGLYQNVYVDSSFTSKYEMPEALSQEFATRPLLLYSRGEAERGQRRTSPDRISQVGAPVEIPLESVPFICYLPNIILVCHGPSCKIESSFLSLWCSNTSRNEDPYPIIGENTEQVYSLTYQCATCREAVITFQLFRKGYRFQLTGRTVPYRPKLEKEWPAEIRRIVEVAVEAAAVGDLPAGYYHLRTAIEHHAKTKLEIPLVTKIEGIELCEQYKDTLDEDLNSRFPSIIEMYKELSSGLHSRNVKADRFNEIRDDLLAHFQAKELLAKYKPVSNSDEDEKSDDEPDDQESR